MRVRISVKALLINKNNKVLFICIDDPSVVSMKGEPFGMFWDLVGGKVDEGEPLDKALLREIYEETGIEEKYIHIGPTVWKGEIILNFSDKLTLQKYIYKLAYTDKDVINFDKLTDEERKTIKAIKWFTLDEIKSFKGKIYPIDLRENIEKIINGDYPKQPIKLQNIR